MTKERICMIAQITYHLLFLSGASFYVTEFQKTRDTIVQQVDRLENNAKDLQKTGNNLKESIKSFEVQLKKIENSCNRVRL